MGTPKFIILTDSGKRSERVNVDRIIRYFRSNGGATVIYGDDHSEWYAETPEQIDAMLGVTANPVRDVWQSVAALTDEIIDDGNIYLLTDGKQVLTGAISRNDWGVLWFPTSDLESIEATHWMRLPDVPAALSAATGTGEA